MNFYAVKNGHKIGVYTNWEDCQKQISGYSNGEYKKYKKLEDAVKFIDRNEVTIYGLGGKDFKKSEKAKDNTKYMEIQLKDELDLKEDEAVAYVDGSFDLSSFTYSYGVVFFTKDDKKTYSGRDDNQELAQMRNVSGELKAAMVAMEKAKEKNIKSLYLHYDYKGIEEWAEGRWKTNKEGTKGYKKFYDDISKDLEVIFIKVPAHAGIKYNEEADRLAKEAL